MALPEVSTAHFPPGYDRNASVSHDVVVIGSCMLAISTLSVALRFLSRKLTRIPLLWDDWLILVAMIFNVVTCAISIKGAIHDHFGTHVAATGSVESITEFLKGLYVFQISYTITIGIAKLSIIALYYRIFSSSNMTLPLRITAGIVIAWIISITLVVIFSCSPPSRFWLFNLPDRKCIDSQAFFIASACPNIITDIVLLSIPLFVIARLHITLSQKMAVCGIFALGIFGTICSILRLVEQIRVYGIGLGRDPTWDLVAGGNWTVIEASVCVVCACLPSMRPLLRLMVHGSMSSYRRASYPLGASQDRASTRVSKRGKFLPLFGKPHGDVDVEEQELQWAGRGQFSEPRVPRPVHTRARSDDRIHGRESFSGAHSAEAGKDNWNGRSVLAKTEGTDESARHSTLDESSWYVDETRTCRTVSTGV